MAEEVINGYCAIKGELCLIEAATPGVMGPLFNCNKCGVLNTLDKCEAHLFGVPSWLRSTLMKESPRADLSDDH